MEMTYAGFWRRFAALIIDCFILGVIGLLLGAIHAILLSWFLSFLYTPFFEASVLQGTPGKALMELRVVTLTGGRISFKQAVIRFFMRIVSSLILCFGYLMMLFTQRKQTLHDLVAETLVIKTPAPAVNYARAWYEQLLEVLGMIEKSGGEKPLSAAPATGLSTAAGVPSAETTAAASTPTPTPTAAPQKPFPTTLAELYELLLKGAITEQEYNQKKEEILKKL